MSSGVETSGFRLDLLYNLGRISPLGFASVEMTGLQGLQLVAHAAVQDEDWQTTFGIPDIRKRTRLL